MSIPKLSELRTQVIADLESEMDVNISPIGKLFLTAVSGVWAGLLKLVYLSIAKVQKNIFVDTAEEEVIERFGEIKLGRSRFAATQGKYQIAVTGQAGATIPAGTLFKSNDNSLNPGFIFSLDSVYVMPGANGSIEVRAVTGGVTSRLAVADQVTATSPLTNVDDVATVTAENEIPKDRESLEQYRQATIDSWQLEAQGGASTDYRLWSADVQGVLRVYPYAKSLVASQVDLFVEATVADSTDGKGTPGPAIIQEVDDVVNFDPDTTQEVNQRGRRPTQVIVNVLAVTPKDVEITLNNANNLTAGDQTLINDAISTYIQSVRPFVDAADIPANRNDILSINDLIFTIQNVISGNKSFESLTLVVDGAEVPVSVLFQNGDIPVLESLTYA